jgi:hypothetical protein
MYIWYVYDKLDNVIAYTEDFAYAIDIERAGFIVKKETCQ